jgi:SAM-dependent methyltransferase
MIRELTPADYAALIGVAEEELPPACRDAIAAGDLRYEVPQGRARDAIILRVLQHIESDKPTKVGEQLAGIWESCWSENLQRFVEAGCDPDKLVPDFIKPDQPVRLDGEYVVPRNPRFELNFLQACRAFIYDRFLAKTKSVYEFGCGSGFNLLAFSRQFPGRKLYGLDWSKSSNETIDLLRDKLGIDIAGRTFDFFNPDRSLDFDPDSGVMTVCALEQVGPRHGAFLDFLLEKKPTVCVNMEPLLELYDENNLIDYLAARFHRKRGYLEGFLPALQDLEAKKRIEILEVRRFRFGSTYHEGYSYIAWRPR